ncbi:serine/arginine-rich splicing factor SR45a [Trifolium repens]|nr:serine/arginine-rich splicing factor SR45a [Trifolium repens]
MADSPPQRRNSRSPSPSPWKAQSRSRSRSRSVPRQRPRSDSRGRGRSRSRGPERVANATNPGNTLYVTGLSSRVTERDLEDHFNKEGKVASCFLVVEPRTRISRGFAFVTMDSHDDAERCIKYLNQSVLEGRYITVERSRRKRARTPTPGHYLGLKNTRDYGSRGDHRGDRGDRGDFRGDHRGDFRGDHRGDFRGDHRGDHRGDFRGDHHGDRGRYRGGSGRGDYSYHRSPRRSPYRGGHDHSPQHSPYVGRSRRERSRSIPQSPYSPERRYAGGSR